MRRTGPWVVVAGACVLLLGTILPWVRFEGCCENSGMLLEQTVLEEDGGWIIILLASGAATAGITSLFVSRPWQLVAAVFAIILGAVAVLATIVYTAPDALNTASYTALPGRIALWAGAIAVLIGSALMILVRAPD